MKKIILGRYNVNLMIKEIFTLDKWKTFSIHSKINTRGNYKKTIIRRAKYAQNAK